MIARAYAGDAEFRMEVARPGRTNQSVRNRLRQLDALVEAALQSEEVEADGLTGGELTWRLLSSLRIRELQLEGADSNDAREVEDLEARAEILRRRFLDELPAVQSLVGVLAPANLVAIFDEIDDFGPKIAASVSVALHLRFDGKRFPPGIDAALGELDRLVTLLNQARDLLRAELLPI